MFAAALHLILGAPHRPPPSLTFFFHPTCPPSLLSRLASPSSHLSCFELVKIVWEGDMLGSLAGDCCSRVGVIMVCFSLQNCSFVFLVEHPVFWKLWIICTFFHRLDVSGVVFVCLFVVNFMIHLFYHYFLFMVANLAVVFAVCFTCSADPPLYCLLRFGPFYQNIMFILTIVCWVFWHIQNYSLFFLFTHWWISVILHNSFAV